MRKFCIAIFSSAITTFVYCQVPTLQWATAMHSTYSGGAFDTNNGRSVAVDLQGNVYSVGIFFHTVDFDPGPAVFDLTAQGPYDWGIYILKQDPDGRLLWAKQLPVLVEFSAVEMEIDADNNVYVTSNFNAPADMDPGPGVLTVTPIGGKDAFILKLDTNGNFVWVKQFGGPGDTVAQPTSIDIDAAGNIYTSGIFINTVDFDPGTGTSNLSTVNHWEGFISKITKNGEFVWVRQIGKFTEIAGSIDMHRLQCDPTGNCFFSGTFFGACDFDPGTPEYRASSAGLMDGFIASLDAGGNFKWMRQVGNSTLNYYVNHTALALDENNNVYTAGTFIGTQDFDPGPGTANITEFNNGLTPYILKLDENGNYIWAKKMAVAGNGDGTDITIDNAGNIYTTSNYYGDIDFGPGPGTTFFPALYGETVLTKFNAYGDLIYAAPFLGEDYSFNFGRRLKHDAASNLYITGYFYGQVDFDPGLSVFNIYGSSSGTPFVLKLAKCTNATDSTLNVIACNEYILNAHIYKLPGTYQQTIPNAAGCDSVITLRLTLNKKFTGQSQTICEGSSFIVGSANHSSAGIYTDTLLSASGCDSIVTTNLFVNPRPLPSLGADRNICENTQLNLSPGVFKNYLWQDGSSNNDFIVYSPGTYFVSVTNNFNCKATDSILIKETIHGPKDFLIPIDSFCNYGSLAIQAPGDFSEYMWSTGSSQKSISVNAPGQYWLDVKDENGCYGKDTIIVYSKECNSGVYIPTAFTPDGNGQNDVFRALVFGSVKTFHLQVFNRWGEVVFETSDPGKAWNGSVKGTEVQTTVFAWICSYQLDNVAPAIQKGTVLLIK